MHHGVRIQDAALVAAAVLSDRYITGRQLPDKAIDLVDEAASRLRIEIDSMPFEIDVVERRIRQLEIERAALAKEHRRREQAAPRPPRGRAPVAAGRPRRHGRALAAREGRDRHDPGRQGTARAGAPRRRARRARRRSRARRATALRPHPGGRARGRRDDAAARRAAGRRRDAQGRGRRGRHRRDRRQVDRRPRLAADGRRAGEAGAARRGAARARDRPGLGGVGGRQRDPSVSGRALRSAPADRLVPVPRPDRRRQDRARAHACRLPVRRRAGDGAHRHVGVHGEALGVAARRRAAGLRRLRGGRSAHRSRSAAGRTR